MDQCKFAGRTLKVKAGRSTLHIQGGFVMQGCIEFVQVVCQSELCLQHENDKILSDQIFLQKDSFS